MEGQNDARHDTLQTATEKSHVTLERRINPHQLDRVHKSHVPRAFVAVDRDHPHGSSGHEHHNLTVLQQHVAFFDRNGDGIIYPWETYSGLRAIGFNMLVSVITMTIIHMNLSYLTLDSWIPSPLFPIIIKNIHRDKHGSDSEVYDTEGRFVPEKFEEIFSKYAGIKPDHLKFKELFLMTQAIRNACDPFGWAASKLEWGFTYWLVRDEEGFASKDAIRGVYDGSFFEYAEKLNKARHAHVKKQA